LWPDVINGLNRLSTDFLLATLSNGNTELLSDIAENSGLSWDFIFSAEDSKHYKPDQEVYLSAIESLGLDPKNVLMVAAHAFDLEAAQKVGMKTAYVYRELEFGPDVGNENIDKVDFEFIAEDFEDLARQLGC
jgi:2-haloacid dehalogenase